MDFEGKVALVTGAGNGIGRQLALQLTSRGATVAAVDRDAERLQETAGMLAGKRATFHVVDVTDRAAVERLASDVLEEHGALDVLINNAGIIQPFVKVADLDLADIERVMNVNFYGVVYMTQAFLGHLLERPEAHISNVSSMGGFLPVPGQAIYGASKAAVKLMTEALYAELLDTNVGVSVIMPGAVATSIAANSGLEMDQDVDAGEYKSTRADEAAETILDGIEDGDLHILVGSDARLMSLASRLAPKGSIRLIQRQMKNLLHDDDESP